MRRRLARYTAYFKASATPSLWHDLNVHQEGGEAKNKAELVEGFKTFWLTVATRCEKYIWHLRKVIPRIIELNGYTNDYWFILLWFCCIQINSIHWADTPLCCCMSVSLHQGFITNRWSHVAVCTGRKPFTIQGFEPGWSMVLWIDRNKHMEVCEGKPGMGEHTFQLVG